MIVCVLGGGGGGDHSVAMYGESKFNVMQEIIIAKIEGLLPSSFGNPWQGISASLDCINVGSTPTQILHD